MLLRTWSVLTCVKGETVVCTSDAESAAGEFGVGVDYT